MLYDDELDDERSELTGWLARHLVAERGRPRLVVITLPAPAAPLETFMGATEREYGVVWHPPDGPACAASGATAIVKLPGGKASLPLLRESMRALFADAVQYVHPDAEPFRPRLFGGLAFSDSGNDVTPWEEFSDGCFNLPRWTYTRSDEHASLTLAVHLGQGDALMMEDAILAEYETISEAISGHVRLSTQVTHFRDLVRVDGDRIKQVSAESWKAYVDAIRRGIRDGTLIQVVAARPCVVDLPEPVDDSTVLARLAADFSETTRFAFRRAHSTLLGASPEVLFSKRGRRLSTVALAGTIRSLGSDFPRESRQALSLLNNQRELLEHAAVLNYLMECLAPLVERSQVDETPHVRKVRNIIHLESPVDADLRAEVDAVHLLEVLHPTAAVGGIPRAAAVDFIRSHEQGARGWYTGAVGWIDTQGDACFNVAIRAGVLQDGRCAHIYTGAGIVAESDAETEYAETELKQQPMLRALGIV